jgi:flagellar hook-basal body complex protein FliE
MAHSESVKNAVKKMPETADTRVNAALAKVKGNPLVGMNFRELFVSSASIDNPNDSVLSLVTNTLKEIGNSRYKYAGIIDKINLMEANGAPVLKPTDVTVRRTFVENMSKFLGQIVGLYQALSKMKKQVGTTPEEKTGEVVTAMNEQAEKMRHLIGLINC